jgi:hypothetical protein
MGGGVGDERGTAQSCDHDGSQTVMVVEGDQGKELSVLVCDACAAVVRALPAEETVGDRLRGRS